MKKRILVAGGTGLVGRNLTNKLSELDFTFMATSHKGSALANNSRDFVPFDFCEFQDCLLVTKNIDTVILCAAVSYGAKNNNEMPTAAILPNLKIFTGLFEACARNDVKTVIMLSSSTVYQPVNYPIKEVELDLNQSPYLGYFGVGWTYRYIEQLAALYSSTYGMKITILRPTNIYGPFDRFDEDRAHIIPSLIRKAVNRDDPFEVWGSPNVVRDFIFVDDLIDDILAILRGEVNDNNLPVNICNGKAVTIEEAAKAILQVCNYDTRIYFNSSKPSAIPYRVLDNARYLQTFGDNKRTALECGIKKTVEWYKKNRPINDTITK